MFSRRLSLSDVAFIATFALVVIPRASAPLIDGDVWWHIRAGNEVLSTGRVPNVDAWSVVGAGMRWISQDWLSNVVLALGDRLGPGGWWLLSIVYAGLAAAALLILLRALRLRDPQAGWLGPLIWLVVGLTVAGPILGVRVQVVDLPLAALVLLQLWRYLDDRRLRRLAWLPLIAVAWANLHAGWVLLFLLGGAVLVGEAADRTWRSGRHPEPLPWAAIGRLAVALVIAALALVVNPNGIDLYRYPFVTAAIAAHRDFLAEWSPPDIGSLPGQLFVGFGLIGVAPALILGRRRLRAADLLIVVGLTVLAADAARFLLVMGPLVATIVALSLDPELSASRLGRRVAPLLRQFERARPGTAAANAGVALAAVAIGFVLVWGRAGPSAQQAAIAENMPVAAVDWIVANDPGIRPFNWYSWGGYLGFRRPEDPIYIDGRSDIYGDGPIREYAEAVSLETDPQQLFDRYRIDYVLFAVGQPLAGWLDASPDWQRVYADGRAGVWVRRTVS